MSSLGLALLGLAVGAFYLGASWAVAGDLGLPLDDSWIHQALARSLALTGAPSINPGEVTTATTSPLWTLLLAIGYKLGVPHLAWAYGVGLLAYVACAWILRNIALIIFPERTSWAYLSAGALLLDWRFSWAAVSGMETVLFSMVSLLLVAQALKQAANPLTLGLLGGLAALSRPEGAVLFLLTLAYILLRRIARAWNKESSPQGGATLLRESKEFVAFGLPAGLLFLALLLPYLYFNYKLNGTMFASTFYAKNAFYASGPILSRAVSYLSQSAVAFLPGALLILLPGVIYIGWKTARALSPFRDGEEAERAWLLLLPFLWLGVLWGAYFVWLPVPFLHHGRYLMPGIPFLVLLGVAGSGELLGKVREKAWRRRFWAAVLALSAAWSLVGAVVYACNVKFIQDNQVAAARWVNANTPPGSWMAAHDVGALGYFSGRRIIDTVGLITPELNRDPGNENKIVSIMEERGAETLVVFPSWHPWALKNDRFAEVAEMEHRCPLSPATEEMLIMRFKKS